jgi:hypothetical protein
MTFIACLLHVCLTYAVVVYGSSFSAAAAVTATSSSSSSLHPKHPVEDIKSWQLHLERTKQTPAAAAGSVSGGFLHRKLQATVSTDESENDAEDNTPYTIVHKKPKKHIPFPGGDTSHGIMIDAGSVRYVGFSRIDMGKKSNNKKRLD